MGQEALVALKADFRTWATQAQLPPAGDWLIWLFLGGRGAGKTRAGAEWVRAQVKAGVRRIALVGPTFNDVREVMIDGPSGLANIGRLDEQPRYEVSRKRLVWPNGAEAYAFSAEDPDGLRGPQFEIGWGDEFAAWSEPQKTLDTLRMGLRLGETPRLMLSTTPRPIPALKALVKADGVVTTHQPTSQNAANLAPGFLAAMQAAYGGSTLGRQEIEGVLIDDPAGALWRRAEIEAAIVGQAPELDRIIIAVDPPASGGARSDECGIVIAGAAGEGASRRAYVLADRSFGPAMPADWARVVAESFEAFEADGLVAEANQGGEMVRSVLQAASSGLPVRLVHASRGKHVRAEPVAALYAAGRVFHAGRFAALEDQMCAFGAPGARTSSPDRVDALVWAVTDLLLQTRAGPRIRRL
ncbi:DNA-packaging protein [Maricaulis sp.]|uniref:DNA-packaging protein n=1 Tax=Maricaulis sp. TaxID=1486257 RepID=UPI003A8DEC42